MPITDLYRPIPRESEEWLGIEEFVVEKFRQAADARKSGIEDDYARWLKNYEAVPREKTRILPWRGSSNIVVPLIQIFVDTFVARTLNIVAATRPFFVSGFTDPNRKKALETYLDYKARRVWGFYDLTKDILYRAAISGICVTKTISHEKKVFGVSFNQAETEYGTIEQQLTEHTLYSGPKTKTIPFEDVYLSPITANCQDELELIFHRISHTAYSVERNLQDLELSEDEITSLLRHENSHIKLERAARHGVSESRLQYLNVIECKFTWLMEGQEVCFIAKFLEENFKLFDLYVYPYPPATDIYGVFRPFHRVDFIYGRSIPQSLEQIQEETTDIHNSRRNNSMIANAPVFKKRRDSLIPNPSSVWYPGKVFELDDMNDLEAVMIGRQHDPMLGDEQLNLQYAERLTAISAPMQGMSQGGNDKRGVYNAAGTLALLAEGNQRQDSAIRDIRQFISQLGSKTLAYQVLFHASDPDLGEIPSEFQPHLAEIFQQDYESILRSAVSVEASSAHTNKEIERRNLLDSVGMLMQYSQSVQQYAQLLLNPQLQGPFREIIVQVLRMHKWLAGRILNVFDINEIESILPDVLKAFNIEPGDQGVTIEALQQTAGMQIPQGGPDGQAF